MQVITGRTCWRNKPSFDPARDGSIRMVTNSPWGQSATCSKPCWPKQLLSWQNPPLSSCTELAEATMLWVSSTNIKVVTGYWLTPCKVFIALWWGGGLKGSKSKTGWSQLCGYCPSTRVRTRTRATREEPELYQKLELDPSLNLKGNFLSKQPIPAFHSRSVASYYIYARLQW